MRGSSREADRPYQQRGDEDAQQRVEVSRRPEREPQHGEHMQGERAVRQEGRERWSTVRALTAELWIVGSRSLSLWCPLKWVDRVLEPRCGITAPAWQWPSTRAARLLLLALLLRLLLLLLHHLLLLLLLLLAMAMALGWPLASKPRPQQRATGGSDGRPRSIPPRS